jgi:hypothetical protein
MADAFPTDSTTRPFRKIFISNHLRKNAIKDYFSHLLSNLFADILHTRQCYSAKSSFGGDAMPEGLFDRYFRLLAGRLPEAEYGVIADVEDEVAEAAPPVCLCRR